ncbi:hypothetical protein NC99_41630 [Sunxiuqinia dokdonensis]|uniref:Uncharacterized protein n=1 Tax=Sunxiuqinia dokdonensis TaxID=1409788 RepID=A0A0L8V3F6_9BACT|nr:hypothetical protein NC99_41630 [Sunxiuqinia dokdonensis]
MPGVPCDGIINWNNHSIESSYVLLHANINCTLNPDQKIQFKMEKFDLLNLS